MLTTDVNKTLTTAGLADAPVCVGECLGLGDSVIVMPRARIKISYGNSVSEMTAWRARRAQLCYAS